MPPSLTLSPPKTFPVVGRPASSSGSLIQRSRKWTWDEVKGLAKVLAALGTGLRSIPNHSYHAVPNIILPRSHDRLNGPALVGSCAQLGISKSELLAGDLGERLKISKTVYGTCHRCAIHRFSFKSCSAKGRLLSPYPPSP